MLHHYTIRVLPGNMIITASEGTKLIEVLHSAGLHVDAPCDGRGDCGKRTVLLDGQEVLACGSCLNPQVAFGADVISRIQYAMDAGSTKLQIYRYNH